MFCQQCGKEIVNQNTCVHCGWSAVPAPQSNIMTFDGFQITLWEDRMTIAEAAGQSSFTIPRETAKERIQLKTKGVRVRRDDGKRTLIKFEKKDSNKPLKLTALQAWMNPDKETNPRWVNSCLKKWTCLCSGIFTYLSLLLGLCVFGLVMMITEYFGTIAHGLDTEEVFQRLIETLVSIIPSIIYFTTVLILLRFGQMWILYVVILCFAIGFLNFLALGPVLILVGFVLCAFGIYASLKVLINHKRFRKQMGV